MIQHPQFDPVAIQFGPVAIHWYGIAYAIAFIIAWQLGRIRSRDGWRGINKNEFEDLLFYCALGIIIGGRLGYVLFYGLDQWIKDPLFLFYVHRGGMSFHGGLLGVIAAMFWFARSKHISFFQVSDFVAPLVPPGLFAGRIANFVNGELWGKATDVPWGVVFFGPNAGNLPRHPSQLYEAALEGLVLFFLLWWVSKVKRVWGIVSGWFLIGYGVARFTIEFWREPDDHIGYLALNWVTMGHILTLPMIIGGIAIIVLVKNKIEQTASK